MKNDRATDVAVLILRVGIGLIALYHGAGKALGVFGGPGIQGTIGFMGSKYGIPPAFAVLAIAGEFLGGLGMIFGLLTQVAAFGFACTMAVATYVGWKTPGLVQGVFTGDKSADASKLFYSASLMFAAIAVMILGGGKYSLDNRFFRKKVSR